MNLKRCLHWRIVLWFYFFNDYRKEEYLKLWPCNHWECSWVDRSEKLASLFAHQISAAVPAPSNSCGTSVSEKRSSYHSSADRKMVHSKGRNPQRTDSRNLNVALSFSVLILTYCALFKFWKHAQTKSFALYLHILSSQQLIHCHCIAAH